MIILKSPQREKFCQLVASGKSHHEAYLKAYPKQANNSTRKTINDNAFKLMQNTEILQRIEHLKSTLTNKVIEKFAKTKDDILIELEEVKNNSFEPKIKIDCLKEQGKLLGYYEDSLNVKGSFDIQKSLSLFKSRAKHGE